MSNIESKKKETGRRDLSGMGVIAKRKNRPDAVSHNA